MNVGGDNLSLAQANSNANAYFAPGAFSTYAGNFHYGTWDMRSYQEATIYADKNRFISQGSNAPWMAIAQSQLGVKEATGNNDGVEVSMYLNSVNLKSGPPWCGAFVYWSLGQVGISGPKNPAWALNWRRFGQSLDNPAFGSIATLTRKGGGHVGFVAGADADRSNWIVLLGGNQSDAVTYRSFPLKILRFNYANGFPPSYTLPTMKGIKAGIKMQ